MTRSSRSIRLVLLGSTLAFAGCSAQAPIEEEERPPVGSWVNDETHDDGFNRQQDQAHNGTGGVRHHSNPGGMIGGMIGAAAASRGGGGGSVAPSASPAGSARGGFGGSSAGHSSGSAAS